MSEIQNKINQRDTSSGRNDEYFFEYEHIVHSLEPKKERPKFFAKQLQQTIIMVNSLVKNL